jgi:hypothetical protein
MYKKKRIYAPVPDDWPVRERRKPDWKAYHVCPGNSEGYWGHRDFGSHRRQWASQREADLMDEDGHGCAVRARDRNRLPDAWDDLQRSRRFYVKCWKDYSRKRKQWE